MDVEPDEQWASDEFGDILVGRRHRNPRTAESVRLRFARFLGARA